MITQETKQTILSLYQRGVQIRQISQTLKISRNTIRPVVRGKWQERPQRQSPHKELSPIIQELFKRSEGNAVRIQEILESEYSRNVPYSTLTRIVRDLDLREDKLKRRPGTYEFAPGQEMQHDTSLHQVLIGDRKVKAQCAGLVLGYSRKLFMKFFIVF